MVGIATPAPTLSDPGHRPRALNSVEAALAKIIHDPRDLPFVWLMIAVSATVVPYAIFLIFSPEFSLLADCGYLVLVIGCFLLPFQVMYHDVAHRRFVRQRYRILLSFLNWLLGPLFGSFPNCFYAHHVVMHHTENNLEDDLSSTLRY